MATRKKMKRINIYDPHYDAYITYLIGGTVDNMIKFIKRKHKDSPLYSWGTPFVFGDDADTTNAYQFHVNAPHGKGEIFYVWIHELNANLLFHETFHLTGDILYTRGIPYTYSSEEAYAYLGGSVFEKIFRALKGRFPKTV